MAQSLWHNLRMRRAVSPLSRIYVPDALAPGAAVCLPPAAAHHLSRVLRAALGDEVVVFGAGIEYSATITRMGGGAITVKLGAGRAVDREMPLPCRLAQAVSSGDRMDITLQKAVELGVSSVQPIFSERSVVRLSDERATKRVAHWRQVMISACEQCGRNLIPDLAPPLSFADWLATLAPATEGAVRILLSPQASARPIDLPLAAPRVDHAAGGA